MADGMSDAGSGIDSSMAAGAAAHEDELAVDMRYTCRLCAMFLASYNMPMM
jgi:hypothetical protein